MDVSIICSTWKRTNLLERSMETWVRSAKKSGVDCEILVYNDDPDEHIASRPAHGILVVNTGEGRPHGSHATGYNEMMKCAEGEILIFTHPEILFPANTVEMAWLNLANRRLCLIYKVYLLHGHIMKNLNILPWRRPEELENMVLEQEPPLAHNLAVRDLSQKWHSTQTFALRREDVDRIGDFPEFGSRGPNDPWHFQVRRELGLSDVNRPGAVVYHQSHTYYKRPGNDLSVERAIQSIMERASGQDYTVYENTNGPGFWEREQTPEEEGKV